MTDLHLKLDAELLTLEDMENFEAKRVSWTWVTNILARMARDEYGVPLPHDDAMAIVRQLTLPEANRAVEQLLESVTVPKASASP